MIGEEMEAPMGWWAISGEALLDMLRRCHGGEDPDVVYAEEYANSHVDNVRAELDGDAGPAGAGE